MRGCLLSGILVLVGAATGLQVPLDDDGTEPPPEDILQVDRVTRHVSVRSASKIPPGYLEYNTNCDSKFKNLSLKHTMCLKTKGQEIFLSERDKQAIVDKHNEYRGKVSPPAANLVKLVWDEDLAIVAKRWTLQCILAHDSHTNRAVPSLPGISVGQNGGGGHLTLLDSVISWYENEVDNFMYGHGAINKTYPPIGHYTQVVSDEASRVGCGSATCPDTSRFRHIHFCNYAKGQSKIKQPYKIGPFCSECPTGKCDNNVCDCGGLVCYNGGTLDSKTCGCSCTKLYRGNSCEEEVCPGVECQNGGLLDASTCQCQCSRLYGGKLCQTRNKCPTSDFGWCVKVKNQCFIEYYKNMCPVTCGECSAPCGGLQCQNWGELDAGSCTCNCKPAYTGKDCSEKNCPLVDDTRLCSTDRVSCENPFWLYKCPLRCGDCPKPPGCNLECKNGGLLDPDECKCSCMRFYSGDDCSRLRCPSPGEEYGCSSYTASQCERYWNLPYVCPRQCRTCS